MKTRDDQTQFIRLNGPRIAACAWNGFEKKGRGVVCVLSDLENELQRTVPFDFMPATDAEKILKPWEGSREKRMIEDYDPKIEVVICFVRKGKNHACPVPTPTRYLWGRVCFGFACTATTGSGRMCQPDRHGKNDGTDFDSYRLKTIPSPPEAAEHE